MEQLPHSPSGQVVRLSDGSHAYVPQSLPTAQQPLQQPVIQHIHQAPPDRTVQRLALGSGVGAGAVAAGVYFGPLLVGVLTAIAANLAILAFLAAVLVWGVVHVIRSVNGTTSANGKALARRRGR